MLMIINMSISNYRAIILMTPTMWLVTIGTVLLCNNAEITFSMCTTYGIMHYASRKCNLSTLSLREFKILIEQSDIL